MALQQYLERGRNILLNAKALEADEEVYRVDSARVWHPHPSDSRMPVFVCIRCGKHVEDDDTYRRIVTRRKGTSWTDRTYWYVHNACFMGKNIRGFQ